MDGARLFNAATYLAKEPADIVRDFDSVSICFSKGLGAPVGSAIAASSEFIKEYVLHKNSIYHLKSCSIIV